MGRLPSSAARYPSATTIERGRGRPWSPPLDGGRTTRRPMDVTRSGLQKETLGAYPSLQLLRSVELRLRLIKQVSTIDS